MGPGKKFNTVLRTYLAQWQNRKLSQNGKWHVMLGLYKDSYLNIIENVRSHLQRLVHDY